MATRDRGAAFMSYAVIIGLLYGLFLLSHILPLPVFLAVFMFISSGIIFWQKIKITRLVSLNKQVCEELKEAQDKIKQTRNMLVKSARMSSVGTLAGGVAHEINNPLIGVLNNVQLIKIIMAEKKDFTAGDFKELLDIIENSALRCAKVSRALLDFSYSSNNAYKNTNLNDIVEKTASLLAHEVKLNNITINKDLDTTIPLVLADPQMLGQAMFDIIANAQWAIQEKSGKSGGLITIKTVYEPVSKQVILSISDNGIGVPEENLKKIFEPFFTTKSSKEAAGLGLSIVYDIIREHKGEIEARSKKGAGAEFMIKLPVV